ncbi:MAG TPA: Flp family type IVb pilin [Vicinamibacterales bacterium]|nr:Flp family type IVb pilin [Vicinamibacterales bacterium]
MQSPDAIAVLLRCANQKFPTSEEGQDLLEYGLLAALIAMVALGAVSAVGQTIYTVFWKTIEVSV